MTVTPPKARAIPTPALRVRRSRRTRAASNAMATGDSWLTKAAVPASTRLAPALIARL